MTEQSKVTPVEAQAVPDVPLGAIFNGRAFAERLETTGFECVAGDLRMCADWQEFRRCFEHLAEWALFTRPTPAAADLHQQIMNLPCHPDYKQTDLVRVYSLGHRDARHAAAQLVAASPAAAAPQPLQPPMRHIPGVRVELLARAGQASPAAAEVWRDPDTGREVPKPAPCSVNDARKALGLAPAPTKRAAFEGDLIACVVNPEGSTAPVEGGVVRRALLEAGYEVRTPSPVAPVGAPTRLQGLADYLRAQASAMGSSFLSAKDAPHAVIATLREWADEVDAARGQGCELATDATKQPHLPKAPQ